MRTVRLRNETIVAEFKVGTSVKHGRHVTIHKYGKIDDAFFKENKLHGPLLVIYPWSYYEIRQWENDECVSL